MNRDYIPAPRALSKLKEARNALKTVSIYGATGYGKTRIVKEYLDFHKYTYIDCLESGWSFESIPQPGRQVSYVVIDNLQQMDSEREEELKVYLNREDLWLVLISRSPVASWSLPLFAENRLFVINEEDLWLGPDEVMEIAKTRDITLTHEEAQYISVIGNGNAFAIGLALNLIATGQGIDDKLRETVDRMYLVNFEDKVMKYWSPEMVEFLMTVGVVDEFTLELAETLTGDTRVINIIYDLRRAGNFINIEGDVYAIRPIFLKQIRRVALRGFGGTKIKNLCFAAGKYYERHNEYMKALKMYELSDNRGAIKELLIRNARRNTSDGYFWEFREHYLALSEEEILASVPLMSAMSVLQSVLMNPTESERWYGELASFAKRHDGGRKKAALSQLAYLDIMLPHRGSEHLIDILNDTAQRVKNGEIELAQMPLTNNRSSIIRGGKDLYEFVQAGDNLENLISADTLTRILKTNGDTIMEILKSEIALERGEDLYKVLAHVTYAHVSLDAHTNLPLFFVVTAVQMKVAVAMGDYNKAVELIQAFETIAKDIGDKKMVKSAEIGWFKLALRVNDKDKINEWMAKAPSEDMEFCSLERHVYMAKARGYIAQGKLLEARMLLNKMNAYATRYNRVGLMILVRVLSAVVCQRSGVAWREILEEALLIGQEYGYVRTFGEEGAAVYPLLKELDRGDGLNPSIEREYYERVIQSAGVIAAGYPKYLNSDETDRGDFSESAIAILKLQAEGMKIREIAQTLHLSESTVKYHCGETYRKLKVKGKTEAVQKAKTLKII
ncbi:MAG: hypothetical protein KBS66_07140 [Eubacterium sp.]|nr:hypothetical protein [Candidatus Colimonas fimequi]